MHTQTVPQSEPYQTIPNFKLSEALRHIRRAQQAAQHADKSQTVAALQAALSVFTRPPSRENSGC